MLERDYKFYLAFENSNCDDYITEKLWHTALRSASNILIDGVKKEGSFNLLRKMHETEFIYRCYRPNYASKTEDKVQTVN